MNSKKIRDIAFITHRYIGLAVGILAAAIGLTGSLLIIHGWQSHFSTPSIVVPTGSDRLPLHTLVNLAQQTQPNAKLESLNIPQSATQPITAWWLATGDQWLSAAFNPYTGAVLRSPHAADGQYTDLLYKIHITLMGGDWGGYVAGIVGLLATILCITGIVLWPGWRKLAAGFKIKWNASLKRLNFDLHKVAGIIAAMFLAMAMFTGFVWNFGTWTYPMIYALTFSQPSETPEPVSQPITNTTPLPISAELLQTATAALPNGAITALYLPTTPEGTIRLVKQVPGGEAIAYIDQYSGQVIRAIDSTTLPKNRGDRVLDSFGPVHFGTFAGEASRILYVFVGLSPTILLITGLIMWWHRKPTKPKRSPHPSSLET